MIKFFQRGRPASQARDRKSPIGRLVDSRMHPDGPEQYEGAGAALKEHRGEELTNIVREYMTDPDEVVRHRACALLADILREGDDSVIPDLINALPSHCGSTAMKALADSGVAAAVDPIIEALAGGHLTEYEAAGALKRIDMARSAEVLRTRLAEDEGRRYKWAETLVYLGDTSSIPLLKKYSDRGEFRAYGGAYEITQFVTAHSELHPPEETQTCVICGTVRPVSALRGSADLWFCVGQCWKKRGSILPTGIGRDCPFWSEGLCTAGGGDHLCSLQVGHYLTDCYVYSQFGGRR